ncbi:MAG: hypothetical protein EXR74_03995 [Bdellovibrionales bacterium]|nr:hypothetical protein [Bdellovibrionales bacterium]
MTKFVLILGLQFLALLPAMASEIKFVMDCGVKEAYAGQPLLCQFIIISSETLLDVEVVKFPEFRGYWSENLSLRQGPIGLLPFRSGSEFKKQGVVGSYLIHKMVDKRDSEIIPMKITVKSRSFFGNSGAQESQILQSESPPLKIYPLPLIPLQLRQHPFIGMVGNFYFINSEISVPYRPEEPLQLKITLQGRGNFSEINTLPLQLPENSEIISHRSLTYGIGETPTKTFEYSILIKKEPPPIHDLGSLLFFDPGKLSYQKLKFPQVKFIRMPLVEQEKPISFSLPKPESNWSPSFYVSRSRFFWGAQIFLVVLLLSFRFFLSKQKAKQLKTASPAYQRQLLWKNAFIAQRSGDSTTFVQLATAIFIDLLKEKTSPLNIRSSHYPTKKQFLLMAKPTVSKEQLGHIELLFKQYDKLYSPEAASHNTDSLVLALSVEFLKEK